MLYNPSFFEDLTDIERLGVLKHEFYHLIFQHVTGRLPPEGMSKMWNVATDLAINSFIADELPEGGCIPGKGPFEDYPLEQSAEWYFSKLQNDDQFKPDDGDGEGQGQGDGDGEAGDGQGGSGLPDSLDDHSGWGDVDQETRAMAEERLKDAVRKATQEVNQGGRGWGSVSAQCRKKIQDMVTPRVNWRSVFVTSSKHRSVRTSGQHQDVSTSVSRTFTQESVSPVRPRLLSASTSRDQFRMRCLQLSLLNLTVLRS